MSLAPYDLFSSLATQPGQTTLLASPGVIEVYVDGTLRMDCARISPGVTELSQ